MRGFVLYFLLGLLLILVAPIAGSVADPRLFFIWVYALAIGLVTFNAFLVGQALVVPIIFAAEFAFPVTCVAFPLVALIAPRKGAYDIAIFAVLGALPGLASVHVLITIDRSSFADMASGVDFVRVGLFGGAILGAFFGYAIWRIDRIQNSPATRGEAV